MLHVWVGAEIFLVVKSRNRPCYVITSHSLALLQIVTILMLTDRILIGTMCILIDEVDDD